MRVSDVLKGFARILDDNGLGRYIDEEADPLAVFGPHDTAIILKNVPSDPDQVIVLNAYGSNDDAVFAMGSLMVQVRVRGAACDDLADAIFDLMHGARYVRLVPGEPAVSHILRQSSLQIGEDGNGRQERTDNYEIFGANRTLHRR